MNSPDDKSGSAGNLVNNADSKVLAGRYEVISQISTGGMGVIHKANDLVLNKIVALKQIQSLAGDPKEILRFQREAKAASQLKHKSIVQVFDFAVNDSTLPFMVMEYVEGQSLESHLLKRGSLPVSECAEIFEQILDGMAHAHSNGVIHRDLKPANVMIAKTEDAKLRVVVVDFGIAKTFQKEAAELTRSGAIVGSPQYMSPEQISGKSVGTETDVYAIGCMLYRCLTGVVPFDGDTIFDTFSMHQYQAAPSLHDATGKQFDEALENVVSKCLAKRPEDRFESMTDLKLALLEATRSRGEDIHVSELNSARKHKFPFLQAAMIFAVLIAVLVGDRVWTTLNPPPVTPEEPPPVIGAVPTEEDDEIAVKDDGYILKFCSNADALLRRASRPCKKLVVFGSDITDEGLASVAHWPITELDLGETAITDRGLAHLVQMADLSQLRLDACDGITDKGLAQLRKLPKLKILKLRKCRFKSNIVPALTQLNRLENLDLSRSTWLTPDSLDGFIKMTNLKKLDLGECPNITPESVERLDKLMPSCVVSAKEVHADHAGRSLFKEGLLTPWEIVK